MNVNVTNLLKNGERVIGSKINSLGGKTYFIGGAQRGGAVRKIQTNVLGKVIKNPVPTAEQVLVSLNLK